MALEVINLFYQNIKQEINLLAWALRGDNISSNQRLKLAEISEFAYGNPPKQYNLCP